MKNIWIILALGIILRVFLSFATFHPDTLAFYLGGKVVSSGNILNLYDFSSNAAVFNYPPPIYLFDGLFHLIIPETNYGFVKLPYLIFDLMIAFLLLKMFDSKKQSMIAFVFWMFNPIALYSTYMMGQFDIIPTFFTVLSIYFTSKNKLEYSALALGGGIAFKIYPIFLLIPLVILGKNYWEKLKLTILALLPYLLLILPYLSSHSFRTTALFANQSSKSLYANIPVSGGESIILFPVFLIFFYLIIWNRINIVSWKLYSIPLLLFFIFTHFHPQWLIWLTPFLIIDLSQTHNKNILPIILIFLTFTGSLFFFDPSLTVNMFAPLFPSLTNLPSVWTMLHLNLDYNFARSILQTVFASAALYLIYDYAV